MNPFVAGALAHLKTAVVATGRALRTATVVLYDGVVHHLGPTIGTEFNKLHLQDLYRSILTSLGFTSTAALVAFALNYFVPFLTALATEISPGTATLASILITLILDLLRRFGQQSPVAVPTPATVGIEIPVPVTTASAS